MGDQICLSRVAPKPCRPQKSRCTMNHARDPAHTRLLHAVITGFLLYTSDSQGLSKTLLFKNRTLSQNYTEAESNTDTKR